jgi:hypothetical protein
MFKPYGKADTNVIDPIADGTAGYGMGVVWAAR